jgi:hypothetical protein
MALVALESLRLNLSADMKPQIASGASASSGPQYGVSPASMETARKIIPRLQDEDGNPLSFVSPSSKQPKGPRRYGVQHW